MSKVFRGKILADLRKHGLPGVDDDMLTRILSKAATAEWVVYAKPPFGGPRQVLRYLARYVHRVAIGDSRLVHVNDTSVTFRMKDYRDGGRSKLMTLDGDEFLRRFLQHIPPRGFVRIRSSGFLANTVKRDRLAAIRQALGVAAHRRRRQPRRHRRRAPIAAPRSCNGSRCCRACRLNPCSGGPTPHETPTQSRQGVALVTDVG